MGTGFEFPWNLPMRIYWDTFGPFELSKLVHLELPLMDRKRYQQPGNMWAPVLFRPDSWLGSLQDFVYGLWNWGVLGIYNGPWFLRFQVLAVCWLIYVPPAFIMMKLPWQKIVE